MSRELLHSVVVGLALGLAGCGGVYNQGKVTADPNLVPVNYKSDIQAFLRTYLNDPTNIRGAFVSEPALTQVAGIQRYSSCLRFNARKSSGDYEGSKDRLVLFLSGRLDTMVQARPEQCASAAYQPFPELERLSR